MEKAVELGVSDFHPVITRRTENRNLNLQRLEAQIFEAAEQCERLVIPNLHTPVMLDQVLRQALDAPLYVALEREEKKTLAGLEIKGTCGFLIGPEGGFDDEEIDLIRKSGAVSVSLGEAVLRAETASVVCLTHVMLCRQRG